MTYNKPEMTVVAFAAEAIKGGKRGSAQDLSTGDFNVSATSYEADE